MEHIVCKLATRRLLLIVAPVLFKPLKTLTKTIRVKVLYTWSTNRRQ